METRSRRKSAASKASANTAKSAPAQRDRMSVLASTKITPTVTFQQACDVTGKVRLLAEKLLSQSPNRESTMERIAEITEVLREAAVKNDQSRKSAMDAKTICYFTDELPVEIRIRVYEYTLIYRRKLRPTLQSTEENRKDDSYLAPVRGVRVLYLNKQINREAIQVFHRYNRFAAEQKHFRLVDGTTVGFVPFADGGLNTRNVRTLNMHVLELVLGHERVNTLQTDDSHKILPSIHDLTSFLKDLPRLKQLIITCKDPSGFLQALRAFEGFYQNGTAIGIGRIKIPGVLKSGNVILQLPELLVAWKHCGEDDGECGKFSCICFERGAWLHMPYFGDLFSIEENLNLGEVPSLLRSFLEFNSEHKYYKLRLGGQKRFLCFNIALMAVLFAGADKLESDTIHDPDYDSDFDDDDTMMHDRWSWEEGLKSETIRAAEDLKEVCEDLDDEKFKDFNFETIWNKVKLPELNKSTWKAHGPCDVDQKRS